MAIFMLPTTCLSSFVEIKTLVTRGKPVSLVIDQGINLPFGEIIKEWCDAWAHHWHRLLHQPLNELPYLQGNQLARCFPEGYDINYFLRDLGDPSLNSFTSGVSLFISCLHLWMACLESPIITILLMPILAMISIPCISASHYALLLDFFPNPQAKESIIFPPGSKIIPPPPASPAFKPNFVGLRLKGVKINGYIFWEIFSTPFIK